MRNVVKKPFVLGVIMLSVVVPPERLDRDKHSSLLGPFMSWKKMNYCKYGPQLITLLAWRDMAVYLESI